MTAQVHVCARKGCRNHAAFGVGVCLVLGITGTWWCAEHLPAEHRTFAPAAGR